MEKTIEEDLVVIEELNEELDTLKNENISHEKDSEIRAVNLAISIYQAIVNSKNRIKQ
jgi:hypothetical protein